MENIVLMQSKFEVAALRDNLEKLIKSIDKNTFDVAEALHKVKVNNYYVEWGFDSYKSYLFSLNMKISKAQYLTKIVGVMESLSIPRAAYEPVGVTKLREICTLDPNGFYFNQEKNLNEPLAGYIIGLVTKGADMSIEELREHIAILKGLTGEDELVFMNFKVKKIVKEKVILPALALAQANIGSVAKDDEGNSIDASPSRALELILADYLSNPANTPLEPVIE